MQSFLDGRPDHHRVQLVPYQSGNSQNRWTRFPDIDVRVSGSAGIKLSDALNVYFDGPDGRDDLMFTNGAIGNSVLCRLSVRIRAPYNSGFRCWWTHYLVSLKDIKKKKKSVPSQPSQDRCV